MAKALILYQYFYPDDVVSARLMSELAAGLASREWDVTAMPSNRGCHNESQIYSPKESWQGVKIRRLWRPGWPRKSALGRLLNAFWMIVRWSLLALSLGSRYDVLIIGTDPIFSVLVARFWKLVRPSTRIVHWCFDLYPEAAAADGLFKPTSASYRLLTLLVRPAYKCCDLIVDIGSCMRSLLAKYQPSAGIATLTPWALSEPIAVLRPDCAERRQLFGTAALALLYSGNFGRAHSCGELLELMRQLRGKGFAKDIMLVFSVRGNREHVLSSAVTAADLNISFCEFASPDALERRLSAADIHVVSLRPEWTGTVVPSKFFGAIASGRPVLFAGNQDSAVAQWIRSFQLGWVLTAANTSEVAASLVSYMSDQAQQDQMRQHCFQVYHHHFSRTQILNSFHHKLQMLLQEESSQVLHKKASQTEQ